MGDLGLLTLSQQNPRHGFAVVGKRGGKWRIMYDGIKKSKNK